MSEIKGIEFEGKWVNSFGSIMELWRLQTTGLIGGFYSSTTGATGVYYVFGQIGTPTGSISPGGAGVPLAMAIYWRSISGTPNPSWNWVSALSGQFLRTKEDGLQLNLLHALTASRGWPQENMVAGTYLGQLHYSAFPATEPGPVLPPHTEFDKAFQDARVSSLVTKSTWQCREDASIGLTLDSFPDTPFVVGNYRNSAGNFIVSGLVDHTAQQSGLTKQAVSYNAVVQDPQSGEQAAITLSGAIDLATQVMSVTILTSRSTASVYYQTAVNELTFHSVPNPGKQ